MFWKSDNGYHNLTDIPDELFVVRKRLASHLWWGSTLWPLNCLAYAKFLPIRTAFFASLASMFAIVIGSAFVEPGLDTHPARVQYVAWSTLASFSIGIGFGFAVTVAAALL